MIRACLALILTSCLAASGVASDTLYDEQYRPQFHFSPPERWMNDPNGLVYHGGAYELFYQYNPYATRWGPMHWGHATSHDLIHWENHPIALFPDQFGTIFSGSAVLDVDNSSGLGSKDKAPLVAMFTYNNEFEASNGNAQYQGLAYSLDDGRSWRKYAGNPVLVESGQRDFRDPKVVWNSSRRLWITTLAVHDHVAFYSSPDLVHWTHESDFGQGWGAHEGVWECPDLLQVTLAGSKKQKAVLLVSVGKGGPNGGSGTQYFVGNFDGRAFTPDAVQGADARQTEWLDHGTDNYAGSTWSGEPAGDERQLFIGWMSNWDYANTVPSVKWRSAMTLPREITLAATASGLHLMSQPARELVALRSGTTRFGPRMVNGELALTNSSSASGLMELDLNLNIQRASLVTLVFSNAQGERTVFAIDKAAKRYTVDRSASGAVDFSPQFAALQTAPISQPIRNARLHAYIDRSSIELFIDDGQTVFTTIVFPSTPYDKITLKADQAVRLEPSTLYALKSIW